MEINDCNNWYALFVITGEEDKVKERLEFRLKDCNLRIIVPKRKLKERKNGVWEYTLKMLFPGYILLNGSLGSKEYYLIKNVPGLIGVLKNGFEPYLIDKNEMNVISRLIANSNIIGPSSVLLDGGRAVVIDGPLVGMEGLIEKVDKRKGRVKLRLNFVGEAKLVELSISLIHTV